MHSELGDRLARVAAELVAIRGDVGLSQPKLAERAGVHRNSVSDIERLVTMPSADMLRKLADGLATYAPGRRDPELAETYYQRLMRAAGYLEDRRESPASPSPNERPWSQLSEEEKDAIINEEIDRRLADGTLAAAFLSTQRGSRLTEGERELLVAAMKLIREQRERDRTRGVQRRPRDE